AVGLAAALLSAPRLVITGSGTAGMFYRAPARLPPALSPLTLWGLIRLRVWPVDSGWVLVRGVCGYAMFSTPGSSQSTHTSGCLRPASVSFYKSSDNTISPGEWHDLAQVCCFPAGLRAACDRGRTRARAGRYCLHFVQTLFGPGVRSCAHWGGS